MSSDQCLVFEGLTWFRVSGSGLRLGLVFRGSGLVFSVQCSGFKLSVWSSKFRVQESNPGV